MLRLLRKRERLFKLELQAGTPAVPVKAVPVLTVGFESEPVEVSVAAVFSLGQTNCK